MGFLPKTEPWQTRREKWLEQLDTLATESRLLLADKGRCARILAVQTLKLFLMFTLPWFCIRFMGLSCGLTGGLSGLSKLVLILTMYIGRLGPLTVATLWIVQGRRNSEILRPEETISVG